MLVMQIVTGIILAMHYTPNVGAGLRLGRAYPPRRQLAAASSRRVHAVGASMFFFAVYIHIFRGLYLRLVQGAARDPVDPRRAASSC